ncbi:MAG: hypothetical protein VYE73_11740 [Acidobacteriota bacterium]|nr:hypothetical protein [Acidobacteriota bacterium]
MTNLRFALRSLAKTRGLSLTIILTLAIGIGAATTLFGIANVVYWRKPEVRDPGRVVQVHTTHRQPAFAGPHGPLSWPDYVDYRDGSRSFDGLAAFRQFSVELKPPLGDGDARAVAVTGNYFQVAPHEFTGTVAGARDDFYLPAHQAVESFDFPPSALTDRTAMEWDVLGRLAARSDRSSAAIDLGVIAERLDAEHPAANLERRVAGRSSSYRGLSRGRCGWSPRDRRIHPAPAGRFDDCGLPARPHSREARSSGRAAPGLAKVEGVVEKN